MHILTRTQAARSLTTVLGLICALATPGSAQNLRELARAQAAENPGVALHLAGPPGDYRPKGVRELAMESDVVLRGTLARVRSYLGANEDRVLTDYRIDVEQVVAGNMAAVTLESPGSVAPLMLTVLGGDLTLEGVLIRATDPNRDPIVDGRPYLLFLAQSRNKQPRHYEIKHGGIFEIADGRAKPLLRQGDVIFNEIAGSAIGDVSRRIEALERATP